MLRTRASSMLLWSVAEHDRGAKALRRDIQRQRKHAISCAMASFSTRTQANPLVQHNRHLPPLLLKHAVQYTDALGLLMA